MVVTEFSVAAMGITQIGSWILNETASPQSILNRGLISLDIYVLKITEVFK